MKCPKCRTENPENNKFCRECGEELPLKCRRCGAEVLQSDKFCGDCRQSLTVPIEHPSRDLSLDEKIAKIQRYLPEGKRKQDTVLFCDMEVFTARTERLGALVEPDKVREELAELPQ